MKKNEKLISVVYKRPLIQKMIKTREIPVIRLLSCISSESDMTNFFSDLPENMVTDKISEMNSSVILKIISLIKKLKNARKNDQKRLSAKVQSISKQNEKVFKQLKNLNDIINCKITANTEDCVLMMNKRSKKMFKGKITKNRFDVRSLIFSPIDINTLINTTLVPTNPNNFIHEVNSKKKKITAKAALFTSREFFSLQSLLLCAMVPIPKPEKKVVESIKLIEEEEIEENSEYEKLSLDQKIGLEIEALGIPNPAQTYRKNLFLSQVGISKCTIDNVVSSANEAKRSLRKLIFEKEDEIEDHNYNVQQLLDIDNNYHFNYITKLNRKK